jgi:hypothetical protein
MRGENSARPRKADVDPMPGINFWDKETSA